MQGSILVVDDNADLRRMLCYWLGTLGFVCVGANDGSVGLDILKSTRVNGVLLDVNMPLMDGLTMLRELRIRRPDLPVLMMSSDADKLKEAVQAGANGYVLKPFDFDLLRQQCRILFG